MTNAPPLTQVVTVGLKTVREMCVRCPRIMDDTLLADLVLYRTDRDKQVKNAARALLGLFRELKPSMLAKKERGRGADMALELLEYGAADVRARYAFLVSLPVAKGQAKQCCLTYP